MVVYMYIKTHTLDSGLNLEMSYFFMFSPFRTVTCTICNIVFLVQRICIVHSWM